MRSIGEFFQLFYLFFKVKIYLFLEEIKVKRHFYSNRNVRAADKQLRKSYRFRNPYRISKNFLSARRANEVDLYGETPLTTWDQIARNCAITDKDHLIELGSGIGRGALFLRHWIGCSVTGVEWIPEFAMKAEKIAAGDPERKIHFHWGDFLEADLSCATVIYLYGTCLEDAKIQELIRRFAQLPQGTRIITVSFPLSDYSPHFVPIKQFSASFPWGTAEIFLDSVQFDENRRK